MNLERHFALTKNRFRRFATHTLRRARNEQRIIASLTSYPPRIHTAHLAIRSLLAQKTLPDLIVLWLYTGDFPNREADLPQELLDVLARDVQIRWVEQDLKPHKKYYWAFQEFPDELVITFDEQGGSCPIQSGSMSPPGPILNLSMSPEWTSSPPPVQARCSAQPCCPNAHMTQMPSANAASAPMIYG